MWLQKEISQFLEAHQIAYAVSENEFATYLQLADYELNIYLIDKSFLAATKHNPLFVHQLCLYNFQNQKRFICIRESEWHIQKSKLYSRLKSTLGLNPVANIGANTTIIKLNNPDVEKFLRENHTMGYAKANLILGLVYKSVLAAVACFGSPLWMKNEQNPYYSTELIRFCTLPNINLAGALSKLLKYYQNQFYNTEIMTYINLEWSNYQNFKQIGFEVANITDAYYIDIKSDVGFYRAGNIKLKLSSNN